MRERRRPGTGAGAHAPARRETVSGHGASKIGGLFPVAAAHLAGACPVQECRQAPQGVNDEIERNDHGPSSSKGAHGYARGAFSIGDAVQAAPTNPAIITVRAEMMSIIIVPRRHLVNRTTFQRRRPACKESAFLWHQRGTFCFRRLSALPGAGDSWRPGWVGALQPAQALRALEPVAAARSSGGNSRFERKSSPT